MPTQVDPVQHMVKSAFKDVTPVRLRLLLIANFLCLLLFTMVATGTIRQHADAVRTVGVDAAPSVIAAHEIAIAVEEMDADLANELLYSPGLPEASQFVQDFERCRSDVCRQLVAAAKNITYGKAEEEPIENMQVALGRFEMQVQEARDLQRALKGEQSVLAYCAALDTLENRLLPAAAQLDAANANALASTYAREKSESALSRGLVLVVGIVLVTLLIYTQFYLKRRFRRRLNIPFLIATFLTVLFVQHLTSALAVNSHDLKVAKEDAYDSVLALLDARAAAYEANAAESRWLLDRSHAIGHEKTFKDKASSIASFAQGHNFNETITRALKQAEGEEKLNLPGFRGSLADELNNIRFEGERDAAVEALQAFQKYCLVDAKIRALEGSGHHDQSVSLCLAYDPNGSKFQFIKFDDALGRTLKINQEQFQHAVKRAFADIEGLLSLCQLFFLSLAISLYLGLRTRMAEYV